MIDVSSALCGVEDACLVGTEDALVGLDGDGEDALGESGLHLVDVVGGDVGVVGDLDGGGLGLLEQAGASNTSSRGVGVRCLKLDVVFLEVVVGALGYATVATVVAVSPVGARNDLLLRERVEGASGFPVSELVGLDGGESPA